jgi:hypothetical protein
MVSFGQWLERIMAPRVLLITTPRVQEFRADLPGHTLFLPSLCASHARWSINRRRVDSDEEKQEDSR